MLDLSHIPGPSKKRIAIHVKPAAERSLRAGHPWLFEDSITKINYEGRPGDQAVVYDRKNRFLAIGLYDPYSPIRVRVLAHQRPQPITTGWFKERLLEAFRIRLPVQSAATTGCRLVHGENDGFPGLVLDKYGRNLVIKLYTSAWIPYLDALLPLFIELTEAERIVLRLSRNVQRLEGTLFGLTDGRQLLGPMIKGPVEFYENGLRFTADIIRGQKTGYYLDQRENRADLEEIIRGERGFRTLLNAFAYSGPFSIYGARAGVSQTTNIDSSKAALQDAMQNFRLNSEHSHIADVENHFIVGDAFDVMDELVKAQRYFDVVVIDPPSFAKRNSQITLALQAYGYMVKRGIQLLRKGGLLAMFSCSSRVLEERFYGRVNFQAQKLGRPLYEIKRTGHPIDHPKNFDQGAYLKGIFAIVP